MLIIVISNKQVDELAVCYVHISALFLDWHTSFCISLLIHNLTFGLHESSGKRINEKNCVGLFHKNEMNHFYLCQIYEF